MAKTLFIYVKEVDESLFDEEISSKIKRIKGLG
jgi:hypothetical protein